MPTKTELLLMEKLVRAKVALEKATDVRHKPWCHAEDLTGWPAPCNCGADKEQDSRSRTQALRELNLDDI